MPPTTHDLHGSAPDKSPVALLLIDVINDFDFEGADALWEQAQGISAPLTDLKRRARALGIPAVYVNDNFGKWQSDFHKLVMHCQREGARGCDLVQRLAPDAEDYFVLKPKHSGFYATPLDLLLHHLGARTLILTGLAGNICVFFTANDAHIRDYQVIVPSDCIASNTRTENDFTLAQMRKVLDADTRPAAELDLRALQEDAQEMVG